MKEWIDMEYGTHQNLRKKWWWWCGRKHSPKDSLRLKTTLEKLCKIWDGSFFFFTWVYSWNSGYLYSSYADTSKRALRSKDWIRKNAQCNSLINYFVFRIRFQSSFLFVAEGLVLKSPLSMLFFVQKFTKNNNSNEKQKRKQKLLKIKLKLKW